MANLTGYAGAFSGDTSEISTTKQYPLGTRAFDTAGNEYMYVQGVASGAAGSWVSVDEAHVTTLLAANAVGRVGVLMAALDATTDFGWMQIYGKNTIAKADTVADNKSLYIDATAGQADDAGVAGDAIFGAVSRSATASGVITVELNYPHVMDGAYLT
jgi:hypothetical protein